jgi:hypothetical protein
MEINEQQALEKALEFTGGKSLGITALKNGMGYHSLVNIGFKIHGMESAWGSSQFKAKVHSLQMDQSKKEALNNLGADAFLTKDQNTKVEIHPFLVKIGIIQHLANIENE